MSKDVQQRDMLKSDRWDEWADEGTDQRLGRPRPAFQKPPPAGAVLVDLVPADELTVGQMPLIKTINRRRSRRQYTSQALTLEELSFLLWATQGVDEQATMAFHEWSAAERPATLDEAEVLLRTVPSAGARHPFETYLLINHVSGHVSRHGSRLEAGLYRYLPLDHKLHFLRPAAGLAEQVRSTFARWQRQAAVIFLWSVLPYRTEWRYSFISPKLIAMDAGHLCQNLYLAAEAIGAGACAVGGYDQEKVDALLSLDGQDEFTVYVAPVGKVDPSVPYHFEH
jgi:SagB-type dehydrogenase family enzyme